MLKKNLIAIAIMMLGLGISGTAYGQFSDTAQGLKSPRDVASGQIKSPRDIATGQIKVRSGAVVRNQSQKQQGQNSSSRVQPRHPLGMNKADLTEHLSIRKTRRQSGFLGDTATHEVGH